jgi:hypothetical protein
MEKIASPDMDISHRRDVVKSIVEVLESESAAAAEKLALAESSSAPASSDAKGPSEDSND